MPSNGETMSTEAFYRNSTTLLCAMANEKRLRILSLLIEREASVGEIAEHVDLSQSAVSQHLKILRMHQLIKCRRISQSIFYSNPPISIRRVFSALLENANDQNPVLEKSRTP